MKGSRTGTKTKDGGGEKDNRMDDKSIDNEIEKKEEKKNTEKENKTKSGRTKKEGKANEGQLKEQNKFFIDASKDIESKELILRLLNEANNKSYGREIILKDLVYYALPKISSKDIEKIQEGSLSKMQKIERALSEFNRKNNTTLDLADFLVQKLGIS